MTIKGCKTIAEYAFRRWMVEQGFLDGYFSLEVTGNDGVIKDNNGNTLMVHYDTKEKCVIIKDEPKQE